MIESSEYNSENYPRECFWTQERETRVKSVNRRLSANRPSNNWAQEKWKTKVMQNFGVQIRCIMGDVHVACEM